MTGASPQQVRAARAAHYECEQIPAALHHDWTYHLPKVAQEGAYRTPPEEREALRRLLCEPMSPGVDYESAIWGASQVLLLIREEKAKVGVVNCGAPTCDCLAGSPRCLPTQHTDNAQEGNDMTETTHPDVDCSRCDHKSDCSLHNEPAYPNGPCDCDASRA